MKADIILHRVNGHTLCLLVASMMTTSASVLTNLTAWSLELRLTLNLSGFSTIESSCSGMSAQSSDAVWLKVSWTVVEV